MNMFYIIPNTCSTSHTTFPWTPRLKMFAGSSGCQLPTAPLMYPISSHQTNGMICICTELYINRSQKQINQSHTYTFFYKVFTFKRESEEHSMHQTQ